MNNYFPPKYKEQSFNCPNCSVYSKQEWVEPVYRNISIHEKIHELDVAYCSHCYKPSIWYKERLIIPDISSAPQPHIDMPNEIIDDYNEAASILNKSPRGSAALLRLALQKLMVVLGQPGKDINKDIGTLVSDGLPVLIQQALDIVRVVGNESVHPGQMDIHDDPDTALRLFELLNIIVEDRISRPKQINELYSKLPAGKLSGIEQRDRTPN